jgi:Mg2+-importing ATPase
MRLVSVAKPWWLTPLPDIESELAAAPAGLSSWRRPARLLRLGPNVFRDRRDRSALMQFMSRFTNPLVIVLLAASAISAFTGETANFVIITFIVLLSVTLDFVQEYRAGKAADKLRMAVSLRATVMRDSHRLEVPAVDVVPGDILVAVRGRSHCRRRRRARSA